MTYFENRIMLSISSNFEKGYLRCLIFQKSSTFNLFNFSVSKALKLLHFGLLPNGAHPQTEKQVTFPEYTAPTRIWNSSHLFVYLVFSQHIHMHSEAHMHLNLNSIRAEILSILFSAIFVTTLVTPGIFSRYWINICLIKDLC